MVLSQPFLQMCHTNQITIPTPSNSFLLMRRPHSSPRFAGLYGCNEPSQWTQFCLTAVCVHCWFLATMHQQGKFRFKISKICYFLKCIGCLRLLQKWRFLGSVLYPPGLSWEPRICISKFTRWFLCVKDVNSSLFTGAEEKIHLRQSQQGLCTSSTHSDTSPWGHFQTLQT